MSLKVEWARRQVLKMPSTLNFKKVYHELVPPGVNNLAQGLLSLRSVFSLRLPGAHTIHMNGSFPVLKNERTACGRKAINGHW